MCTSNKIRVKTPSVWVGCIACYNDGKLNGTWVEAIDADAITPESLHNGPSDHEELWCYDVDSMLRNHEMDPSEATKQAELLESVDVYDRQAFRAWANSDAEVTDTEGLPDLTEFQETYQGEWNSFHEYADDFLANSGLLDGVDEAVVRYFDFDAFCRDLKFDYTIVSSDSGTVFVFSDN